MLEVICLTPYPSIEHLAEHWGPTPSVEALLCEDDATVRVELWKPDRLPVRNFDFESYKAALAREQEGWEAEA